MSEAHFRLFDTHCHFDRDEFSDKIDEEISIAKQFGVEMFLIPGCGAFNWERIESICNCNSGMFYSLGLHPYFIEQHLDEHLNLLDQLLSRKNSRCVAVGECGLDFYHSRESEERQKTLLSKQIQLANKYHLPLILHSRKAHQESIKMLRQNNILSGGVIHAFTGSVQQAMDYINLGFFIGVGGSITYPRATKTRQTISQIPLSSIVLETDAPDMPIFGHQGENNHPKNLKIILNELNVLRSEDKQTIADQVFKNSKSMYTICE